MEAPSLDDHARLQEIDLETKLALAFIAYSVRVRFLVFTLLDIGGTTMQTDNRQCFRSLQ